MTSSASHRTPDSDNNAKSPAFQFYPKDFLTDENVRIMSLQERGAYITLLSVCWIQGSLPASLDRLAKTCGVPLAVLRRLWPALEPCFRIDAVNADRLLHPRLEREREKQANFARRQSDRGKLGGRPRKPEESGNKATALPPLSGPASSNKSSAFASSSAFADLRQKERARASEQEPPDGALARRAGDFVESYRALHRKYLRGAEYVGPSENFDYLEAVKLCRIYDDERLSKLATVWLNMDDEFALNGTRTLAKFRSRASKCDELLREKGL